MTHLVRHLDQSPVPFRVALGHSFEELVLSRKQIQQHDVLARRSDASQWIPTVIDRGPRAADDVAGELVPQLADDDLRCRLRPARLEVANSGFRVLIFHFFVAVVLLALEVFYSFLPVETNGCPEAFVVFDEVLVALGATQVRDANATTDVEYVLK